MNYEFKDGAELFSAIIQNPQILALLPESHKNDIDFLEIFYIILNDKIKPYISNETYNILKRREIRFKNQNKKPLTYKPIITLNDELEILHDLLTNPQAIEKLPTDEKYKNEFLEFIYIIWGDEIEPYIPYEMFEHLKNESLMHEYHQEYNQKYEELAEEINNKKLTKKSK